MIYPNTPADHGISIPDSKLPDIDRHMQSSGLWYYAIFKGTVSKVLEIKDGYITLQIIYPKHLPDNERDYNYILMVMAHCLGRSVLDRIFHVLLLEYESPGKGGYIESDYYTEAERSRKIQGTMLFELAKVPIRDRIFDRNYLIDLFK